ncbi:helix-turn-helix domain-containing protein [Vibrio cholerae]|uniref:helix-turn-helix domain-containing protein n=2 Tax=Vibrio cholerae TaxID=666 RepID=UPI002B4BF72E|nr:helix-turn-helix transcriptional regulator [Vibrio cholerae]
MTYTACLMSQDSLIQSIRHRRQQLGMTQSELAEKARISATTYKRIEQGTADLRWSQYQRIVQALGVSELDLLLDRMDIDNISERDLLAIARLFPDGIRRLLVDFLKGLHQELNKM